MPSQHQPRGTRRRAAAGRVRLTGAQRYATTLWRWTERDFESRYRRSSLRSVWSILQPFFFVSVYVLIFGVIFQQTGGDLPYLSYLLGGVVVYRVVSAALNANTCLVDNHSLITQVSFHREVVPLSQVLGSTVDMAVTTTALLVVAVIQGLTLRPTIVLLPIVLAAVVALACAACVAASTVQVFVRDVQFAVGLLVTALFFASPISYDPAQLPSWLSWLNVVNPISVHIEALRDITLRGVWPDWGLWLPHVVLSVGLAIASIAHLRAVEHRIVDLG